MATTTVTPPAAAAPSTPAPAAAPSTPVSTTPTAPAPNTIDTPVGVQDNLEAKLGAAWEAAKAAVPGDESGEPVPAAEDAPAPAEEVATPATESETAAEPEAKPEAVAQPAEDEFKFALDDDGEAASPETLFKELKADPAAQKFFEDRPELKNKVMAALRRDTENRELRKIVPDLETAKDMAAGATLYTDFDTRFLSATNPDGYKSFIDKWVQEALVLDDKGQPIMENGQYKVHESLPYIMNQIHENQSAYALAEFQKSGTLTPQMTGMVSAVADHLLQKAKLSGDERLEAAAEIFKGAIAPQPSASEEIPEHLRSLQDSLTAKEKALKDQEQAAVRQRQESESKTAKEARTQAIERAESRVADSIKTQLKPLFERSGLSTFEADAALTRIGNAVDELMAKDEFYQTQRNSAEAQFSGAELEKRLSKLMMTWANVHLGDVSTKVLREAKGGAVKRQSERTATVEGQKRVSASDPRGTSIAAAAPVQGRTTNAQIEQEYMAAHNGEKPPLDWVLGEAMKRNLASAR
jgi:hypothetical protein